MLYFLLFSFVSKNLTNYGRRHLKLFTNCHVSWKTLYVHCTWTGSTCWVPCNRTDLFRREDTPELKTLELWKLRSMLALLFWFICKLISKKFTQSECRQHKPNNQSETGNFAHNQWENSHWSDPSRDVQNRELSFQLWTKKT